MPSFDKQKQDEQASQISSLSIAYKKAMPYLSLVYGLFGSIIMIGALGWFGDEYFQTKPFFTILGLFIGLGIGFYNFFKSVGQIEKRKN